MKINYNKNPLRTTVELDEHEKQIFRYKIMVKEMIDLLFGAHFHLTYKDHVDIEKAKKKLDPDYYLGKDEENGGSKLEKRVDMLLEHYLEELQMEHCGDCTCVTMSCSKCHAESILGIDTIPGLRKQPASKVGGAFGKNDERTMDEAIESLVNYNPPTPTDMSGWNKDGSWDKHLLRWKEEAKDAHAWLVQYRDQHFPKGE